MIAVILPAFLDLSLPGPVLLILRTAATLGGAILAWFLTVPVVRLLFRAAFQRPLPAAAVFWCRLGGSALTAGLIFFFLPLGFGGPGWGPGTGGPGLGGGYPTGNSGTGNNQGNGSGGTGEVHREIVPIELLGGDRYKEDKRYYLLRRKEPAVTLKEVAKLFQEKQGRLLVQIILTRNSVGEQHGAVTRLQNLAKKYDIFTLVKIEVPEEKVPASRGP